MSISDYNILNSFQTLILIWGLASALDLLPSP